MKDLQLVNVDVDGLLHDLSGGRLSMETRVHLDPDLARALGQRLPGWRPALGQTGAAHGHLVRQELVWETYFCSSGGSEESNESVIAGDMWLNRSSFGAGQFPQFKDALRLTADGCTRTVWRLPGWFMPNSTRPPLSYHPAGPRWAHDEQGVLLRSAAKGQEFVLDADHYPEAEPWLRNLLEEVMRANDGLVR